MPRRSKRIPDQPDAAPRRLDRVAVSAVLALLGCLLVLADGSALVKLVMLAGAAVAVVVLLHELRPGVLPKGVAWFRRPLLGRAASTTFAVAAAVGAGFRGLPLIAGAALFILEAARRGELGDFEPRSLWRGWRRLLLIGAVSSLMTFGIPSWTVSDQVGGVRCGYYSSSYCVPSSGYDSPDLTAQAAGFALVPGLLVLGVIAWAAWRGRRAAVWVRWFGVSATAAAAAYMVTVMFRTHGDGAHPEYYGWSWSAFGPFAFTLALVPVAVSAVAIARAKK